MTKAWMVVLSVKLLAALLLSSGCGGAIRTGCAREPIPRAALGDFEAVPKPRIGSLPFPSIVSLYAEADPAKLGEHVYRTGKAFEDWGEEGRGILYTCRAGFVDIAHVRNTVDHAAHIYARVLYALEHGGACVRFRLAEPSVYRLEISYPEAWYELGPEERARLAREVAIRAATIAAHRSMAWHELLTWYGYKSTGIISEEGSAFTYEDSVSHAVGEVVAERALMAAPGVDARAFGEAATVALEEVLRELGAVDVETGRAVVESVKGEWWSSFKAEAHHVAGAGTLRVKPRVVEGVKACQGARVHRFRLYDLDELSDHPVTPTMRLWIDPRVSEEGRILDDLAAERGLGERPEEVDVERDLPLLLERVQRAFDKREG